MGAIGLPFISLLLKKLNACTVSQLYKVDPKNVFFFFEFSNNILYSKCTLVLKIIAQNKIPNHSYRGGIMSAVRLHPISTNICYKLPFSYSRHSVCVNKYGTLFSFDC